MSNKPKKYIFVNGIMKQNPEYDLYLQSLSGNAPTPSSSTNSASNSQIDTPLAVVSSLNDINEATILQSDATGIPMQIASSTIAAMENMQDSAYLDQFHSSQDVDGGELLEGLTDYFIQYEVPVGLLNKLFALKDYRLNFIVDDSGSMRAPTDVFVTDATQYLFETFPPPTTRMTRWQEAENRLHIMMDILAYVPTKSIRIMFLNATNVLNFDHKGKSIEQFKQLSHQQIHETFQTIDVRYKTPTYTILTRVLNESFQYHEPTMHYLLTDGVPSDRPYEAVADLIRNRQFPERNPITLLSCSNEDSEVEWMKEVEEIAPFTAEIDDYIAEKAEVLNDQGAAFPYTKGLWMVSQLVAAINPYDLDAMDESLPFTKYTLDNLLGRSHTSDEYKYYFDRNPHSVIYVDVYNKFLTQECHARQLITEQEQKRRELSGGYIDGKPPVRQTLPTYSYGSHSSLPSSSTMGSSYNNAPPPSYASSTGPPPIPPPSYSAPPSSAPSSRNLSSQQSSMGFNGGKSSIGTRSGQVTVPPNAPPGSILQIQAADGTKFQITVPTGAVAGTILTYNY